MAEIINTCFVIIGFGRKMDHSTGREFDLDKTFEYIIKPAFEELNFLCYRASEITHSGVIDLPMYDNILKSDFVVADLSTLNANVLYELGIRHAVRKNTTIIISESELKYPFDLSHIVIEPYEHLGKGIDHGEVMRFKKLLQDKVVELKKNPQTDSPLYTIFPDLEIPKFTAKEIEEIRENIKEDGSLSDFMEAAEIAKNQKDYLKAQKELTKALELNQDNSLVTQRLALVTYKSELPDKRSALIKALRLLEPLNPSLTTDLETLGLSGAIYKRLFEIDKIVDQLQKSIWFYERGFYIGNDYYNGINLAYLFNVVATLEKDKILAIANYGNAKRIRNKVKDICNNHLTDKSWNSRDDKIFILFTMAEIAFSVGDLDNENYYIQQAITHPYSDFAVDSYQSQRQKLKEQIENFEKKYQDILGTAM
ncbi:hypothetical protein Dfri01_10040 [Dyadobacter frigoris]|uniref:tetratricopeptide repeat-containing protein n=1 Tax=Dyadobacter frigoris TaxID=2576211 RepID=UPI0024A596C6|nr:tetratricopeptide repeat-containing protein [Dyadobacter frigoris]GLU51543.1 hypothetical protein Dfri01_10040 [Dyadobacter frigoris]